MAYTGADGFSLHVVFGDADAKLNGLSSTVDDIQHGSNVRTPAGPRQAQYTQNARAAPGGPANRRPQNDLITSQAAALRLPASTIDFMWLPHIAHFPPRPGCRSIQSGAVSPSFIPGCDDTIALLQANTTLSTYPLSPGIYLYSQTVSPSPIYRWGIYLYSQTVSPSPHIQVGNLPVQPNGLSFPHTGGESTCTAKRSLLPPYRWGIYLYSQTVSPSPIYRWGIYLYSQTVSPSTIQVGNLPVQPNGFSFPIQCSQSGGCVTVPYVMFVAMATPAAMNIVRRCCHRVWSNWRYTVGEQIQGANRHRGRTDAMSEQAQRANRRSGRTGCGTVITAEPLSERDGCYTNQHISAGAHVKYCTTVDALQEKGLSYSCHLPGRNGE
ncbi:hypothetical protein Bbelb_165310 [Branchiostoma belcheri]|nr:hypothetical protein Bbelb_165310 [Branchiostoma belcheri]